MKENKSILFITFDLSGYYNCIHKELKNQFTDVTYYNTATIKFKYKNIFQKTYSFFYKLIKKQKLKNYYKLQPIIEETNREFDYILMVRPDLFFDSQLKTLKNRTPNFIAFYHDSINNINRKKEVIHFFDKVYSYEKRDVQNYNLIFLSNFIYLDNLIKNNDSPVFDAFTVMAMDYRINVLNKLAVFFKKNSINYKFLVHSDKNIVSDLVEIIHKRKTNQQVLDYIKKTKILVDIHKFGVQDGLTFRVFESLFFEKKLITTNKDIKTYPFYNKNNIFIIENTENIDIPSSFLESPYQKIDKDVYNFYHYTEWIKRVLS